MTIPGDLAQPEHCAKAVQRTVDELGGLDVLVNNIAYQAPANEPEDITAELWERTFRTNVHSYFWTTQASLPHLQGRRVDHQHELDQRPAREQGAHRLLGDEGRDPRLHVLDGAGPRRSRHPGERGRARPGVDAALFPRRWIPRASSSSARISRWGAPRSLTRSLRRMSSSHPASSPVLLRRGAGAGRR